METQAVIKSFFFLQGKAPKEIHAILTETLACFLPGLAKDLSAPLCTLIYTVYKTHYFRAEISLSYRTVVTRGAKVCALACSPDTTPA